MTVFTHLVDIHTSRLCGDTTVMLHEGSHPLRGVRVEDATFYLFVLFCLVSRVLDGFLVDLFAGRFRVDRGVNRRS